MIIEECRLALPRNPSSRPATELDAVVAHVEMLRAPAADRPAAGDVALGELFFMGRGNCSSCHAVAGSGGVLGPDLSNLGRERTLSQIQRALLQPGSVPLPGSGGRWANQAPSRAVSLRMDDGEEIRGVLKYETLFDMGILDLAGRFRSIRRRRIAEVTREPSIMPPLQASPEETRHLLAYLTRLTGHGSAGTTSSAGASSGQGVSFADIANRTRVTGPPTMATSAETAIAPCRTSTPPMSRGSSRSGPLPLPIRLAR